MDIHAYDTVLLPIIIALVGLFGKMGLSPRWQPAAALILGLIGGYVYISPDDPKNAALVGIMLGLSAIGVYSGVKNTVEKRNE